MNIYSIYKATNKTNGKIYIGIDSNWPKRRSEHNREIKRSKTKFHNAIRKYGRDGFDWCLIYQSNNYEHIKDMECFFIEEYGTFKYGYNMTLGGEGSKGIKLTSEHKNKISLANKGKKATVETRLKMSESQKGCINRNISGIESYWKGRKRSTEDCEKKSEILGKKYIVIDPTGKKMNIKSLRKFCKENGLSASHMGAVARGKRKHHRGWTCVKDSL